MNTPRQPLILAASLAAALALAACGKKTDNTNDQVPNTPPPAAQPATPPAMNAPTDSGSAMTPGMGDMAAGQVTFASVELGSTVDANNRIAASGTSFAPKDSIYASVDTNGAGNGTLAAKWTYQDGQVVHEDSKTLNANGPETTVFMINKPSGFPAGNYKLEISLDGKQVASKDFAVK